MKKSQGFTLIELLVVVAIIGILATVVLASLGSARNKAKVSAISASLSSLRAQGEMFALDSATGAYTGFCAGSGKAIMDDVKRTIASATCVETATTWVAEADLNGLSAPAATRWFCADSTGFAGTRTATKVGSGCNNA